VEASSALQKEGTQILGTALNSETIGQLYPNREDLTKRRTDKRRKRKRSKHINKHETPRLAGLKGPLKA